MIRAETGHRSSSRRGPIAMVLAGFLLVAPLAGMALAATAAPSGAGLGGYGMFADGNGVQVTFDNPAGLGGSHPIGYLGIPEASAKMETGPQGSALSTVVWPGSLLGNLGSASNLLTFLPPSILPLLKNSNDPIRAQSSYPGGPADATYPAGGGGPVAMSAHADASKVDSQSAVTGVSLSGLFQVGNATGHGETALEGPADTPTNAVSTGTSEVGGIDVLGGLLHIDSVKSVAKASSDGTTPAGTARTTIAGVTLVNGTVPATIDSDGLHVAKSTTGLGPLLTPVNDLLNQLLNGINFTAKLIKPTVAVTAGQENAKAGALVITYNIPANFSSLFTTLTGEISTVSGQPNQIPNFFQNGVVTLSIGGATADVSASPGFVAPPQINAPSTPPAVDSGSSSGGSGLSGGLGGLTTGGTGGSDTGGSSLPSSRSGAGGGLHLPSSPIAAFGGLAPLLLLLAVAGAAMIGAGMWKLSTNVLAVPAAMVHCRLEEGP